MECCRYKCYEGASAKSSIDMSFITIMVSKVVIKGEYA